MNIYTQQASSWIFTTNNIMDTHSKQAHGYSQLRSLILTKKEKFESLFNFRYIEMKFILDFSNQSERKVSSTQ